MRTLQNTACVYFELGEAGYKVYGYSGSDLFEYLRGLGFEVYRRCKDGVLERLDAAHGVPEGRHINAFAIRNMRDFLERTT